MELAFNPGDTIRYSSAAGVQIARVKSITVAPTAKRGHSTQWLNLTVFGTNGRRDHSVSIAAGAIAAHHVELV